MMVKSSQLLAILLEAPLPGQPCEPKGGQCGMWQVAIYFAVILAIFFINFVLVICNKFWKKSALRIVNLLISIPFSILAIATMSTGVVVGITVGAIVLFQFYMIYKSMPA